MYKQPIVELNCMSLFQVFFAVLIGAFALGQAGPNVEGLFTAAGAAGTIFETIDRVCHCI